MYRTFNLSNCWEISKLNFAMKPEIVKITSVETDRVVEMAWEDRTPFEAILLQFGLTEAKVIKLMRKELKARSFRLWRARVNSGVSKKHLKKRSEDINRFKCTRQRTISNNKITKR